MIRNHVSMVWITLLVLACSGPQKKEVEEKGLVVTVKGKVGFPQPGEIVIAEIREDAQKPFQDTIRLKGNYSYEKKVKIPAPGYYQLNFYNLQYVSVILDKSDIEVNVDGNNQDGFFEVKGSPDEDLIRKFQGLLADAQKTDEAAAIELEFQLAVRANDETKVARIQEKYQDVVMAKAYDQAADLVLQAPPSLGLISLLRNGRALDIDKYFSVYMATADKMTRAWPEHPQTKAFADFVNRQKKTAVGQPAPEISLPDPDGKVVTLSSFRGKYVLVDFWAKWCGPCRQENPNVVKAYNEFKGKNFDILGVSLDRSKEDWVRAILEDGLAWNHVSDLRYFESQAAKDYNIDGIPFSVLVDPAGMIVAKNLRGGKLQKTLSQLLKKKV